MYEKNQADQPINQELLLHLCLVSFDMFIAQDSGDSVHLDLYT